eukprot:TRINITY_DN5391_c1_g1_i2.p1 TRINITY_DN5391_c1_g1~~TRINITY_DN5391_c1_g1_i2.p1  ORF type:complete len:101 (-),score=10.97 TRINITY_DN5391_c1_g1_i2:45-347(-)
MEKKKKMGRRHWRLSGRSKQHRKRARSILHPLKRGWEGGPTKKEDPLFLRCNCNKCFPNRLCNVMCSVPLVLSQFSSPVDSCYIKLDTYQSTASMTMCFC